MTINKYLQDKVDINEIFESDRDFILNQLGVISHKQDFNTCELRDAVIVYFLLDYRQSEMFLEKTESDLEKELSEISLFNKQYLAEVLNELVDMRILLNVSNKYCLSYAYIMTLEMNNENIKDSKSEKSFIEPRVEAKKFLQAHFEAYQKYDEIVLNDIGMILTECFNFEANSDNGMINFKMNGAKAGSEPCNYNVYLSRGYICLEEEDNTCAENIWHADGIEMLIDLIKDLGNMPAEAQEDEKK